MSSFRLEARSLLWTVVRCAAAVALLVPAASAIGAQAPNRITVRDDLGTAVTITVPIERVVSLLPATTELLFALGAGKRVVGRSDYCVQPKGALGVPALGQGLGPDPQRIIARKPQVVILHKSRSNDKAAQSLRSRGVTVLRLSVDTIGDVYRVAELLGRLTHTSAAADSLTKGMRRDIARVSPTPSRRSRTIAIIVAGHDPIYAIGGASYLSEIAGLAGVRNVYAAVPTPTVVATPADIAAKDPDWIWDTGRHDPPATWSGIRAVKQRKFVKLPSAVGSYPGPRISNDVRTLVRYFSARTPERKKAPGG